jgi:hypothetical protein
MAEERTLERQLWSWLRKGLKPFDLSAHAHRVENEAETGDPDVEGCILGTSFHIELKVAYEMAKGRIVIKMKREQAYWAHCRGRAGGRSYFLVRVGLNRHYLIPWAFALELFENRDDLVEQWLVDHSLSEPGATSHRLWQIAST